MSTAEIIETGLPPTRYRLKAKIIETGHDTFREFAQAVDITPVYLSQVCNGYYFPSPTLQLKMAQQLGLSLRELRELL